MSVEHLPPPPVLLRDEQLPSASSPQVAHDMVASILSVVAGVDELAETAVICFLAGGHLLLEDVPGVAKTLTAQTLAATIGGSFKRIQGTPDLLPGDVTGSLIPDASGSELRFRPGPVFANVVVFDELNRTSPRTQSALFEAAEESEVSVDGDVWKLPDPFMLVATQNPLDAVGTFALSEGTADRFAAVVSPGRPAAADEVEVLTGRRGRGQLAHVSAVTSPAAMREMREAVAAVAVSDTVAMFAVELLHATREHRDVRLGASTRAGVSLIALARARAWMSGRAFVSVGDVVALAPAALAHRVSVADHVGSVAAGRGVVEQCLMSTPLPTL